MPTILFPRPEWLQQTLDSSAQSLALAREALRRSEHLVRRPARAPAGPPAEYPAAPQPEAAPATER